MRILLLITISLFSVTAMASSYQKPDISFPKITKVKKAKIKKEKWDSESHYKIDERFQPEREVASKQGKVNRDPSSVKSPKSSKPISLNPYQLRPWIYKHAPIAVE